MKNLVFFAALIGLLVSLSTSDTSAAVIAYEGFDTPNAIGSDVTAAGVTGSGFSGYGDTNFRMDLEAGLTYSDGLGNTLDVAGKSGGIELAGLTNGTQNLQLSLANTIVNTGTIYTSYLLDVTSVSSFGIQVGLQDSQVTSSASPTSTLEAAFRSTSSNYGIYSDGNGIDMRTGPASAPGSFLVVSELDMDNEVMTTWLNPTNLADVANTASHTISDTATGTWDDMTSFTFSLGGDETGTVDEIRIGTTLADVVPFTPAGGNVTTTELFPTAGGVPAGWTPFVTGGATLPVLEQTPGNTTNQDDDGSNNQSGLSLDGNQDGSLRINSQHSGTEDMGAYFDFAQSMNPGDEFVFTSRIFNPNSSFINALVTLENATDGSVLATSGSQTLNGANGLYRSLNLNYTALSSDAGDTLRVRYTGVGVNSTARDLSIDNLALTLIPVPEPGTLLLAGMGICGLVAGGRRRGNRFSTRS